MKKIQFIFQKHLSSLPHQSDNETMQKKFVCVFHSCFGVFSTELKTATNMFIRVVRKIKSTKFSFVLLNRCFCPLLLKRLYGIEEENSKLQCTTYFVTSEKTGENLQLNMSAVVMTIKIISLE